MIHDTIPTFLAGDFLASVVLLEESVNDEISKLTLLIDKSNVLLTESGLKLKLHYLSWITKQGDRLVTNLVTLTFV